MKESVTKFDLEAAFKALDELDVPVAKKGIAANRVNLKETFNKKLKTEALMEDYYDVNNSDDLNKASENRQAEVAQAKLARIEKIVDLDAETEEDILPSYEGKVIIQCPQCMTLFYKNPEDIEASEEDDTVVNIGEVCQHCGNESGYTVIGKVAAVEPEVEANEESDELNLDFEEPVDEDEEETEENSEVEEDEEAVSEEAEEVEEKSEEAEDSADLDLIPMEGEEEKKEEALSSTTNTILTEAAEEEADEDDKAISDEIEKEEEPTEEAAEEDVEEENTDKEDAAKDAASEDALEVLKDKIDVHGEGDTVVIAEKGQLDNEEAPKVEVEVSEEEFDTLEKEFHDEEKSSEENIEMDADVEADFETEVDDVNSENIEDEESAEEVEEVEESLVEDLSDIKWKAKLDKHFGNIKGNGPGKGYRVVGWAKAVKDDTSGEFYDRRETIKDQVVPSFGEAIESAKTFAKQSTNGIADIYGIEANGDQKLLRTYDVKGKETTSFITAEVKDAEGKVINKAVNAGDYFDYKKELGKAPATGAEAASEDEPGIIQRSIDAHAAKKELKSNNKTLNKQELDQAWCKDKGGIWSVSSEDEIFTGANSPIPSFNTLDKAIEYAQKLSGAFSKVAINASKPDDPAIPVENGENLVEFEGGKMTKNSKLMEFSAKLKESFDNTSTAESLTEDAGNAAFKELMNSEEFKTPISDAEVRTYFEDVNSKEEVAIDDALANVEEIDEESIAKCITESLTNVYENIQNFKVTGCEVNNNTFVIEGLIEFKSGNTKAITYSFNEALKSNDKLTFKGLNEALDKNGTFSITCALTDQAKNLVTEALNYEYSIENAPIKGSVSIN